MNPGSAPCGLSNQRKQNENSEEESNRRAILSVKLPKGQKYFNTVKYVNNSNDLRADVSPNPSSDQVNIKAYTSELFSIEIQNSSG